jgi:hypothetical protein
MSKITKIKLIKVSNIVGSTLMKYSKCPENFLDYKIKIEIKHELEKTAKFVF